MINKKKNDDNTKIQLSLAATMFFAPFVKHILWKWHLDIKKADVDFVNGYVRLWYISLGFLALTIISTIANYLMPNLVLDWIRIITVGLLLWILILGTILVLADVLILQWDADIFSHQEIKSTKWEILLSFIPLYNVYQWYKLHNFDRPYRWAKESLLWWALFTLVLLLTKSTTLSSFVLTLIIIRVASLLSGIDVLEAVVKTKLSSVFNTNVEESWAYISWSAKYLYLKLIKKEKIKIEDNIAEEQTYFKHLFKLDKEHIIIQYIIAIGLFVVWVNVWTPVLNSWIHITAFVLIFGKYIVMWYQLRHLPALPIARELTDLLFLASDKLTVLYNKVTKK